MRTTRAISALCTLLLTLLLLAAASAGQAMAAELPGSELTNSGGDLRTGWYPNEPSITPELVSGGTFGRLWTTPVEGQVYAQPLLSDGTLFVGTEENDLYGLNPATGAVEWSENLGEPWSPGEISCADLAPKVGVTATPVIDPETNVAYLTYKTYRERGKEPEWFMDAVSVSTGVQQPGFPVLLSGTAQNAPGQEFHPKTELQRPGLLLMEGVVYAAFGSDCDVSPWQGWVFGVSTEGAVRARWVADETGSGAGIWQSGSGLASDGPGTILLSTGNGGAPSTPTPGDTPPTNLGESIVRLDVQPGGSLKAVDFFAPYNATYLDTWDADFASGGVTGLPEEYFGTPPFRTSPSRSARTATCICSTATTSAGSARARRAPTTSCSASAPTAASGHGRACGPAKAAGSTSRPPRAAPAEWAPPATCASISTASPAPACRRSRSRPPPPKRSASPRARP